MIEEQLIETEVEAPPADLAPPVSQPYGDDLDLDALRAEYEAGTKPSPAKGNGEASPPDPAQRAVALREQIDATKQLGELRTWAVEVEQERLERREKEDSDALFKLGSERVGDIDHLPPDHAERWLRAEYMIDGELHAAWDNRYDSPDAMRWCQNRIKHALTRLSQAARKMPDPEATASKNLIVAAVMRGASGPPQPKRMPDLHRMTDAEIREYTEENFGYTAGI